MTRRYPVALSAAVLVTALLGLLATLPPTTLGLGQPSAGFSENISATAYDHIAVRDANWNLRSSMAFAPGETIHANVTSTTVDWRLNAGGGGRLELLLQDYRGATRLGPSTFWQYGQAPARYLANLTLSGLVPDWYYLRIRIDDTQNVIEARVALTVGSPPTPHSLETLTDDTFTHPSEVFTTDSVVWVRIVGDPGAITNQWDIYDFQKNSAVGGAQVGFDNFNRNGNTYTFSIDLSSFGPFSQGWFYTLEVSLSGGAFVAGKVIEILNPTVSITPTNLAPAYVSRGQTSVPMMELHLDLDSNWSTLHSPAAFNLQRLRLTRTGTPGANSDVVGIRIYQDNNSNGLVEPGEPLLASMLATAGLGSPTWVGTAGRTMAYHLPDQTLHLLIAYDIAPAATSGSSHGISLAAAGDVDFYGSVGVTGPPLASSLATVEGFYGGAWNEALTYILLALGIAAAIGLLLFVLGRRQGRCRMCQAPTPRGRDLCYSCQGRQPGMEPAGQIPPPGT